jgi:hypothetical protein
MFAGTVPRMIGINGIHTLVMSNNSLEGPLPANLSTNMKVLCVFANMFLQSTGFLKLRVLHHP